MVSPYDQDSDHRIYTPTTGFRFSGLLKKELREILRDRRTVITLILMPLLVYPLLGLLLQKFFLSQMSQLGKVEYRIILSNESEGQLFRALLTKGNRLLATNPGMSPVQQKSADDEQPLARFQKVDPVIKFLIADSSGKCVWDRCWYCSCSCSEANSRSIGFNSRKREPVSDSISR